MTTAETNQIEASVLEQLSAYMDGELPPDEARFLQRRLDNDADLRAAWSRMQLASSCLKGQPVLPMRPSLCTDVQAVLASDAPPVRRQQGIMRWGVAASLVAAAVLFAPGVFKSNQPTDGTRAVAGAIPQSASQPGERTDRMIPSPSSADLVAMRVPASDSSSAPALSTAAPPLPATSVAMGLVASNQQASILESPVPLDMQSPADFPLVENADQRRWPQSELVMTSNEPALEAYLVRHNQMLANDGLGGFVPYLDVVADGQAAVPAWSDADAAKTPAPATAGELK